MRSHSQEEDGRLTLLLVCICVFLSRHTRTLFVALAENSRANSPQRLPVRSWSLHRDGRGRDWLLFVLLQEDVPVKALRDPAGPGTFEPRDLGT